MSLGLKIKFDNLRKNLKSLPFPVSGAPRNIVTALTTTMADVSAGKTANTHMYAKSVAGVILRDCADNHIKERVNQSLTTDQRTTMSPIKNAFRIPTMGSVLF